jgi:hypothetical protein
VLTVFSIPTRKEILSGLLADKSGATQIKVEMTLRELFWPQFACLSLGQLQYSLAALNLIGCGGLFYRFTQSARPFL